MNSTSKDLHLARYPVVSRLSAAFDRASVTCCIAWLLLINLAVIAKLCSPSLQWFDGLVIVFEVGILIAAIWYFRTRSFAVGLLFLVGGFAVWHVYRNLFLVSNQCICFGQVFDADLSLLCLELISFPFLAWAVFSKSNCRLHPVNYRRRLVLAYVFVAACMGPVLYVWSKEQPLAIEISFAPIRSADDVTAELIDESTSFDSGNDYVFIYVSKDCQHCRRLVSKLGSVEVSLSNDHRQSIFVIVEVGAAELDWRVPSNSIVHQLKQPVLISGSLPAISCIENGKTAAPPSWIGNLLMNKGVALKSDH